MRAHFCKKALWKNFFYTLMLVPLVGCAASEAEPLTLLIGTYTDTSSRGIYRTTFNPADGTFGAMELVVEVDNPSYLALSEDCRFLYAVSEGGTDDSSALNAYRIEEGSFRLLNRRPTEGASPCYVRLHDGYAYTANYTGGSMSLFPIAEDGSLGELTEVEYEPKEGSRSHIHGLFPAPDGKSLYVTDLGRSEIFQIEAPARELSRTELSLGAGPRHMAFSATGRQAYALNELAGTVSVFDIEPTGLRLKQEIRSDSVGGGGCADVHLSPDGRFLYASNRLKEDGISVFEVDPEQGTLRKVSYTPTGIHPRNFTLTPDGDYVLVAVRDSDRVEVYRRDMATGALMPTGENLTLGHPVCLLWME